MVVKLKRFVVLFFALQALSCNSGTRISVSSRTDSTKSAGIITGAERTGEYLPILKGKRVGAVVNHTSMIGTTHLIDSLLLLGVKIEKIFAPEHGFRGDASDGEKINDQTDNKTGIRIISVYGSRRKPSVDDLAGLDIILFDIQDVGTRFYTFISTMSYFVEACADNKLAMLVLDRPNPNGHYIDGPVLKKEFSSFVGLHEIPVVHGMTVGEYAKMINGEGWLANKVKCDLNVITCLNYDHKIFYELPVKPSPNLPNMRSVYLYPSFCFFEGTVVSIGRGTDKQFQVLGAPGFTKGNYSFTPRPMPGSISPPQNGIECNGYDYSNLAIADLQKQARLDLSYLINFYRDYQDKSNFFLKSLYIDKLAGSTELREQIVAGFTEEQIRKSWQPALNSFKVIRKKYLLYKDFD
jgi:uncharacterized protein YbbC (DUF1343 family)